MTPSLPLEMINPGSPRPGQFRRAHFRVLSAVLAAFFLLPALARANAGTPLMWLSIFHLVFGNLLIGVVEGLLIALAFKVRAGSSIALMIGANYFSAACGRFGILPILGGLTDFLLGADPLKNGLSVIWGATGLVVLLTVLLEWPFCYWILRKTGGRPWRRALLASLAAQALSYGVLIPLYMASSSANVLTKTKHEANLGFSKNPGATVYYLGRDGALWRKPLNATATPEKIMDLKYIINYDVLRARRSGDGKGWDLILLRSKDGLRQAQTRYHAALTTTTQSLIRNFAARAAVPEERWIPEDAWYNFGAALDLRPTAGRQWKCRAGFWGIEGLRASKNDDKEKLWLSMENPILTWHTRGMTILPGDQVVYQLGVDMIVLLDLNTRQLALVARGHGPTVGLDR